MSRCLSARAHTDWTGRGLRVAKDALSICRQPASFHGSLCQDAFQRNDGLHLEVRQHPSLRICRHAARPARSQTLKNFSHLWFQQLLVSRFRCCRDEAAPDDLPVQVSSQVRYWLVFVGLCRSARELLLPITCSAIGENMCISVDSDAANSPAASVSLPSGTKIV